MDLMQLYNAMFHEYGPQKWWPGDSPWEVCAGAVLTQNTNWKNVEKAIANLKAIDALSPVNINRIDREELEAAIRPSGYFRLKTDRLLAVADWWLANVNDNKLSDRNDLNFWRNSVLNVKGVGPETADSILLYSFNLPTFVIDSYTKRIMSRHFAIPENISYDVLRKLFMDNLPHDYKLFNEFHALLVMTAKTSCGKRECLTSCPIKKIDT